MPRRGAVRRLQRHWAGRLQLAPRSVGGVQFLLWHAQMRRLWWAGSAVSRDEQGCRAGRRPTIEERLAAKDQARHELRDKQMQGVGNWPTGRKGK